MALSKFIKERARGGGCQYLHSEYSSGNFCQVNGFSSFCTLSKSVKRRVSKEAGGRGVNTRTKPNNFHHMINSRHDSSCTALGGGSKGVDSEHGRLW